MLSSSRFSLDDFCIAYKSNNLKTNVHKTLNICLSQTPTHLRSQIIAVTILNIFSGMAQSALVIMDQLVLVWWLTNAFRANRWQAIPFPPGGSEGVTSTR
jgi:hypothetical protein